MFSDYGSKSAHNTEHPIGKQKLWSLGLSFRTKAIYMMIVNICKYYHARGASSLLKGRLPRNPASVPSLPRFKKSLTMKTEVAVDSWHSWHLTMKPSSFIGTCNFGSSTKFVYLQGNTCSVCLAMWIYWLRIQLSRCWAWWTRSRCPQASWRAPPVISNRPLFPQCSSSPSLMLGASLM